MNGARSKGSPPGLCDLGLAPEASAKLDWRPLRRSTVMLALRRATGVIRGYQSDSSSKRPRTSASSSFLIKCGEGR